MDNVVRPVFIVGAPRSGTSLLRSIIDAHPNICCPTWETGAFEKFDMILEGDITIRDEKDFAMPITRDDLLKWCRRSFDDLMLLLTGRIAKPRWAEKTPGHVFFIKLIHEVYPEAQFIHIIRNGGEVVRSLQNMKWAPRKIRWSCSRWVDSVQAGRTAGSQLSTDLYTEIRYEDLVADPASNVQALCKFLGEPFAPQMLAFHEPANNSWGVDAKPLSAKPVNKYRELTLFERFMLARVGGALLRELGYR